MPRRIESEMNQLMHPGMLQEIDPVKHYQFKFVQEFFQRDALISQRLEERGLYPNMSFAFLYNSAAAGTLWESFPIPTACAPCKYRL